MEMNAQLYSCMSTSISNFLSTSVVTTLPVFFLQHFQIRVFLIFGLLHFSSSGQNLFFLLACVGWVAHFGTSIPTPEITATTSAFFLFAFNFPNHDSHQLLLAVGEGIDSTYMLSLNDAGQLFSNVSIKVFDVSGLHSTLNWYVLQRHSSECGT